MLLASVPQFTQTVDPFAAAVIMLIVVGLMVCWVMSSTNSEHRAAVILALTELVKAIFTGIGNLMWGRPGEEPPGNTAW